MVKIKALEEKLAVETNRLVSFKRAQQILDYNLELERNNPIGVLFDEVRCSISSSLEPFSPSYFSFILLDGSAEVTVEIDGPQMFKAIGGLSIKDGGTAVKLLQAFLLGSIDAATNEVTYPKPIRQCVLSGLLQYGDLQDVFREISHLLSRIDSLLKCVKHLETEFSCTLDSESNGDVNLAFSSHEDGEVIKVEIIFRSLLLDTWNVTTLPSNVNVSIISAENQRDQLSSMLQQRTRDMLHDSATCTDPTFLKKVVYGVMSGVEKINVE
jgi:hypothetical protein